MTGEETLQINQQLVPAGYGRRFGAFLIDATICYLPFFITVVIWLLLAPPSLEQLAGGSLFSLLRVAPLYVKLGAAAYLVALLITAVLASFFGGQTVGDRLIGIRPLSVETLEAGGFKNFLKLLVYALLYIFTLGLALLVTVFVRSGPYFQTWVERLFAIRVVDLKNGPDPDVLRHEIEMQFSHVQATDRGAAPTVFPLDPGSALPADIAAEREQSQHEHFEEQPAAKSPAEPAVFAAVSAASARPWQSSEGVITSVPWSTSASEDESLRIPEAEPAAETPVVEAALGADDLDRTRVRPQRPSVGAETAIKLVFDDGFSVRALGSMVLGRNPIAEDGTQAVAVPDSSFSISKTHLRLVVNAESVTITDLHSTNGSMAVAPNGQTVALEPGVPQVVSRKWIVRMGERSFELI